MPSPKTKNLHDHTSVLPTPAGSAIPGSCLCIGLDIAWYGGSKGKPDTQYDCLVSAISNPRTEVGEVKIHPLKLKDRDLEAEQILEKIDQVIKEYKGDLHVVLAIDAPLQGSHQNPEDGKKAFRLCERRLSSGRQAIDRQGRRERMASHHTAGYAAGTTCANPCQEA